MSICSRIPDLAVVDPKLTITAEAKDYIDIVTGKLNAMTALANQQVSYKGDLNLAMKMMQMFDT